MELYKQHFPDFGELDVEIPKGFEDVSWNQDAMPSFAYPLHDGTYLRLFVDYKDREMSDVKEDPYFRFFLSHSDSELCYISDVGMSNDYSEILSSIDQYLGWKNKPSPRPR